jgi:ABC-type sugar transport system permease subunit
MFSNEDFWIGFLNTIVYVGGTVAGEFVFALALLVNYHFRGKNLVNGLFFIP